MHCTSYPPPYKSRDPSAGVLYQTLAEHLATFLYEREREFAPLPDYVRAECEAYLRCGIHHYGFLRVRCPKAGCKFEHAVPFSCKKRGFCPGCGHKRAAEIEEHLSENILPKIAYRQYVLTVPYELRYRLAWDAKLLAVIHRVVIDRIDRFIKDLCKIRGKRKDFRTGSVSFVQRFGSLLNLHPHFHILFTDGCFVIGKAGKDSFLRLEINDESLIQELLASIVEGITLKLETLSESDAVIITEDLASVGEASSASVRHRIAFGARKGQRVRKLGYRQEGTGSFSLKGRLCAEGSGFTLHAGRCVEAEDRRGLSQLITYMARPSLCEARLERGEEGDVYYWLKETFSDGTSGVRLSPSEFIEKLCALVPPKSSPLVRYSGVFAGNFKGRASIILKPGSLKGKPSICKKSQENSDQKPKRRRVGEGSWSRLLKRVFRVDVSGCPRSLPMPCSSKNGALVMHGGDKSPMWGRS